MKSVHRNVGSVLLAILVCGCRSAATTRSAPSTDASLRARDTHENLNAVVWVQTAAEYRALTRQAYQTAAMQLDKALNDSSWTAALEQTSDPSTLPRAVIVDLDETVLDNSAFEARLIADHATFTDAAWNAWCEERKAGAIPGAIEFLRYAQTRGAVPFYISNRDHAVEEATRDVLAKLGAPLDDSQDTVLTHHENGWESSDKSARRQLVASRYRILLLVGDNFEDFATGTRSSVSDRAKLEEKYAPYWGTKWIMLPNPTYGGWEQAITFGEAQPTGAQVLAAKYRALRTMR
jgi:5'-nucleotidase (lipoprotein e(P4) family)